MEGEGNCLGESGVFGFLEPAAGWAEGVSGWAATAGERFKVCMCQVREGKRTVPLG